MKIINRLLVDEQKHFLFGCFIEIRVFLKRMSLNYEKVISFLNLTGKYTY